LVGWDLAAVRAMVEQSRDEILAAAGVGLDVLTQRFGLMEHHS